MVIQIKPKSWKFLNGYGGKDEVTTTQVKRFCRYSEYDIFILVSFKVLEELRHDSEVFGFSLKSSYKHPYPVFCVGLKTDNIQRMLDKYVIDAIMPGSKTINIRR